MPWLKPVALAFQNTMLGQSHHGAVILTWHGLAWLMASGQAIGLYTILYMVYGHTITALIWLWDYCIP